MGFEQSEDETVQLYIPVLTRIGLDLSDIKNNSQVIKKTKGAKKTITQAFNLLDIYENVHPEDKNRNQKFAE